MTPPDIEPTPAPFPALDTSAARADKPRSSLAALAHRNEGELFGRTLKTVGVLVAACVLFVGLLSVAAVAITSKALGPGPSSAEARSKADDAAKKPLSI